MIRASAVWILFLIAVLLGCTPTASPVETAEPTLPVQTPEPTIDEPIDLAGTWVLRSGMVDGQAIPKLDEFEISLVLEPNLFSGMSACNRYGMRVVTDGHFVRVTQGVDMTAMSCGEVRDAIDELYVVNGFARVNRIETISDDRLVLTGPEVRLEYERAAL